MDAMLYVWGALFIPWALGVVLLARSRRHAAPGADLGFMGWAGVILIATCLVLFFVSAAAVFGGVVWIIPMLGFWLFVLWLTFDQMKRHVW